MTTVRMTSRLAKATTAALVAVTVGFGGVSISSEAMAATTAPQAHVVVTQSIDPTGAFKRMKNWISGLMYGKSPSGDASEQPMNVVQEGINNNPARWHRLLGWLGWDNLSKSQPMLTIKKIAKQHSGWWHRILQWIGWENASSGLPHRTHAHKGRR